MDGKESKHTFYLVLLSSLVGKRKLKYGYNNKSVNKGQKGFCEIIRRL